MPSASDTATRPWRPPAIPTLASCGRQDSTGLQGRQPVATKSPCCTLTSWRRLRPLPHSQSDSPFGCQHWDLPLHASTVLLTNLGLSCPRGPREDSHHPGAVASLRPHLPAPHLLGCSTSSCSWPPVLGAQPHTGHSSPQWPSLHPRASHGVHPACQLSFTHPSASALAALGL